MPPTAQKAEPQHLEGVRLFAPATPATAHTRDGTERAVPPRMTLAEFEAFPWREGDRWELIYGVPVMAPSGRGRHSNLIVHLAAYLQQAVAGGSRAFHVLAMYDVSIEEANSYLGPDIMVVADDEHYDPDGVPYRGVPALVVEVLSPSTAALDQSFKARAYATKGIPEYWIVDPSLHSLKVHVLKEGAYEHISIGADGLIHSPFLGRCIRIVAEGKTFKVIDNP